MSWKPSPLIPTVRDYRFKVRLLHSEDSDFKINTKILGLDDHLMASTMAGLIQPNGASNFINDQSNREEATLTFVWSGVSWEESYADLKALVRQAKSDGQPKSDASHLVVGVLYGAQIYCVMSKDVRKGDDNPRKEAKEDLMKIWNKIKEALDRNWNVDQFKKDFEKTNQLSGYNCRMYTDFQSEPVRHCNLIDLYQRCSEWENQMRSNRTHPGRSKGVPITILLCPLQVLFEAAEILPNKFDAYIDMDLVNSCFLILNDLKRIVVEAKKICTFADKEAKRSILEFVNVVSDYRESLQAHFRESVVKDRSREEKKENGVIQICFGPNANSPDLEDVDESENHPVFNISNLSQWVSYKEAEVLMNAAIYSLTTRAGIDFLSDSSQLDCLLSSSCQKYAVVLFVPPLDGWTIGILSAMKNFLDNPRSSETENKYEVPWLMETPKRELVNDWLSAFVTHVEKNPQVSSQVKFIVTFGDVKLNFSIYENGQLLKGNLLQLPAPPTGLRPHLPVRNEAKKLKKYFACFEIEWDHRDFGYPSPVVEQMQSSHHPLCRRFLFRQDVVD